MNFRICISTTILFCLLPLNSTLAKEREISNWRSIFGVGIGSAPFRQQMKSEHEAQGGGYFLSMCDTNSVIHLGINYLEVGLQENDVFEHLQIGVLSAGLVYHRWLKIDVGSGISLFNHRKNIDSDNQTYYTADGNAWLAGITITPWRKGLVSFGASAFYYEASAGDYKSNILSGGIETITKGGNGSVHSTGSYIGLSFLIGM